MSLLAWASLSLLNREIQSSLLQKFAHKQASKVCPIIPLLLLEFGYLEAPSFTAVDFVG